MLPTITKEFLEKEAIKVAEFAEVNLKKTEGHLEKHNDILDYYFGVIRRQSILLNELALILIHSKTQNITPLFIICRCLCDDFINMFYLKLNDNEEENIIRINANASYEDFKSLNILTQSNEKHFKGEYPYYMSAKQLADFKKGYIADKNHQQYFVNIENFEFKKYMQLRQVAEKIEDFELSKLSPRAYYLWSYFSSFIHYSAKTLISEMYNANEQLHLFMIEETILYSFNTTELAFRYFTEKYGIKLTEDEQLFKRYMIKYE